MKRPDKWERMAERILRNAEFSPDCVLKPGIIRALRRTDAAAEKRGRAAVLAELQAEGDKFCAGFEPDLDQHKLERP